MQATSFYECGKQVGTQMRSVIHQSMGQFSDLTAWATGTEKGKVRRRRPFSRAPAAPSPAGRRRRCCVLRTTGAGARTGYPVSLRGGECSSLPQDHGRVQGKCAQPALGDSLHALYACTGKT